MLNNIFQKLKNKPFDRFYIILTAVLTLMLFILFNFCILQSDDYAYASYLKDGLGNFIKLTRDHFININGRAVVHFFLQLTLSLPLFLTAFVKCVVLFGICFFSLKLLPKNFPVLSLSFPSFFMLALLLSGREALKEAVMWHSGFFNYVFPALPLFYGLYLLHKGSPKALIMCTLAGTTTEQWGISAAVVFGIYLYLCADNNRMRKSLMRYFPVLLTLLGYATIYLSPATVSRLLNFGHTELEKNLFDIPRLAHVFFASGSTVFLTVLFCTLTIALAFTKKGAYSFLSCGLLPLLLIILLPLHHSYISTLIITACYIFLCGVVFFIRNEAVISSLFFGALTSVIIMLPTNTFEPRITFPYALLLIIASLNMLSLFKFTKRISVITSISLFVACAVFFTPSFIGFYRNRLIERDNIQSVKNSHKDGTVNHCIDYDKDYALRQMFNDGSFYNSFIRLYNLEECKISVTSKNNVAFDNLSFKGLMYNNEAYVPLRLLLNELGGTVTTDGDTVMTLNNKTLTLSNGMFSYTSFDGKIKYLVADKNKIPDFYTLYIRLSLVNEAFDLSIKAL
ncbi:MAG: hypothetical protein IKU60_01165 [Clostridia bacterium]|nr:hypothetical protein [Clostridia bacterium]